MTTNEEIRQRVLEAATPSVQRAPQDNRLWGYITSVMGASIVFLTVAIALTFVFRFKPVVKPTSYNDSDLRAKITQIETKVGSQEARLKDHAHKIWLLGIVTNENAALQQKEHPEDHIIYFDEHWKLNQMPEAMELSESDKAELQKDIK